MTSVQTIGFTLESGEKLLISMLCGPSITEGGVIIPSNLNMNSREIMNCVAYCQKAFPYIETLHSFGDWKSSLSDEEVDFIRDGIDKGYLTQSEVDRHWIWAEEYLSPERVSARKQSNKSGYVYLIRSQDGYFKIGHTSDPDNRMKTFSVKLPFDVEYVCLIWSGDRFELERSLHDLYKSKHVNGEWFNLSDEDVNYLKGLANDNK